MRPRPAVRQSLPLTIARLILITVPEPVEALVAKVIKDCDGDLRLAVYALAATAHEAQRSASAGMARLPPKE